MVRVISRIHSEIASACRPLENVDYVPQEELEIIATDVFLKVGGCCDGDRETTLISGIRRALFDHVSSLGIQVLPISYRAHGRLDGPVDTYSNDARGAPDPMA